MPGCVQFDRGSGRPFNLEFIDSDINIGLHVGVLQGPVTIFQRIFKVRPGQQLQLIAASCRGGNLHTADMGFDAPGNAQPIQYVSDLDFPCFNVNSGFRDIFRPNQGYPGLHRGARKFTGYVNMPGFFFQKQTPQGPPGDIDRIWLSVKFSADIQPQRFIGRQMDRTPGQQQFQIFLPINYRLHIAAVFKRYPGLG